VYAADVSPPTLRTLELRDVGVVEIEWDLLPALLTRLSILNVITFDGDAVPSWVVPPRVQHVHFSYDMCQMEEDAAGSNAIFECQTLKLPAHLISLHLHGDVHWHRSLVSPLTDLVHLHLETVYHRHQIHFDHFAPLLSLVYLHLQVSSQSSQSPILTTLPPNLLHFEFAWIVDRHYDYPFRQRHEFLMHANALPPHLLTLTLRGAAYLNVHHVLPPTLCHLRSSFLEGTLATLCDATPNLYDLDIFWYTERRRAVHAWNANLRVIAVPANLSKGITFGNLLIKPQSHHGHKQQRTDFETAMFSKYTMSV
jgi:hypothetical protein